MGEGRKFSFSGGACPIWGRTFFQGEVDTPEPRTKTIIYGLWSKFEFSLNVVAACFLFPKWAQPPLNSQRFNFGGRKREGWFRKMSNVQEIPY